MPRVNAELLVWARETAGLSPEEAARKLGFTETLKRSATDRLNALEAGDEAPSRSVLDKMSGVYRRPLLTFYLPEPPARMDKGQDFRRLPSPPSPLDEALVSAALRNIRARQSLVRELLETEGDAEALDFVGSAHRRDGKPEALAGRIAERIGFSRRTYRKKASISKAVAYLRNCVEASGVFVVMVDNLGNHTSIVPVSAFRGFALADKIAPFIAVNANDSHGAQAFTIVHELAHIWLGETGVSGPPRAGVERFCNDVASEFLAPASDFEQWRLGDGDGRHEIVQEARVIAARMKVSRAMVLYKLHRLRRISAETYEAVVRDIEQQRAKERERQKDKDGTSGPSYQVLRRQRAGTALVTLVGRMLAAREITSVKAGLALGVSGKSVAGVLQA